MARSGVASRRVCEEMILAGRVQVNGRPVNEVGTTVVPGEDEIRVDGRVLPPPEPSAAYLVYKPRGVVSTVRDPRGRRRVGDLLPAAERRGRRLFPVGRLDLDSEGLIILTDDGDLANRLMHPRYGVRKEYLADVAGVPTETALRRLVRGVELDDGPARALDVRTVGEAAADGVRLRVVMGEGRKREVRRLLAAVGYPVRRLRRVAIGRLRDNRLRPGQWRRLTPEEIAWLWHDGNEPREGDTE